MNAEQWLATAVGIGNSLCRDAIWAGDRCNWLGGALEGTGARPQPVQRTFGPDLYGGTSGIALFLAQLASLSGERIHRKTALGALRHAFSRLEAIPERVRAGLYAGYGGMAYAALTIGDLLTQPEWVEQSRTLLFQVATLPPDSQEVDVMVGYAGAIPALLGGYARFGDDTFLQAAVQIGQTLLQTAHRTAAGWSWNTLSTSPTLPRYDLTGFSHGTAGIGWVLVELYAVTNEAAFREGAQGAFQYERSTYSPQHRNWPDFRSLNEPDPTTPPGPGYMVAWCHGAPGIGLSRLRAFTLLQDEICRQEAQVALETTAAFLTQSSSAGQGNFSLCHGHAGNSDCLLVGGQALSMPALTTLAYEIGQLGITWFAANDAPWPCGLQGVGETPGLLLGLAGIGYFYLRLYSPTTIPSLLLIEPGHFEIRGSVGGAPPVGAEPQK